MVDDTAYGANLAALERLHSTVETRLKGIFDLALLALKSMTLLSGGAIVALFTLLGHLDGLAVDAEKLWLAFAAFTASLVLVMLAMVVGYVAQNLIMSVEARLAWFFHAALTGREEEEPSMPEVRRANRVLYAALGLLVLSVVAFALGGTAALQAVSVKPPAANRSISAADRHGVAAGSANLR